MSEILTIVTPWGNTVRVQATFKNYNKIETDPEVVRFKVYDKQYNILEQIILGDANKQGTGKYFFDYTTVSSKEKYYFEFYGEISGNPVLKRGIIQTAFLV